MTLLSLSAKNSHLTSDLHALTALVYQGGGFGYGPAGGATPVSLERERERDVLKHGYEGRGASLSMSRGGSMNML